MKGNDNEMFSMRYGSPFSPPIGWWNGKEWQLQGLWTLRFVFAVEVNSLTPPWQLSDNLSVRLGRTEAHLIRHIYWFHLTGLEKVQYRVRPGTPVIGHTDRQTSKEHGQNKSTSGKSPSYMTSTKELKCLRGDKKQDTDKKRRILIYHK